MSTSSTPRDDRDIYRLAPSADAAVLDVIADRLEFRGTDDGYVRLSQGYLARLPRAGVLRIPRARLRHRHRGARPATPHGPGTTIRRASTTARTSSRWRAG